MSCWVNMFPFFPGDEIRRPGTMLMPPSSTHRGHNKLNISVNQTRIVAVNEQTNNVSIMLFGINYL